MSFSASRTLRFGDCDPSGIAYFPAYLDMLVGVLEDFFAALGAPWPEMIGERGIGTPTVRLDLEFARPGLHGARLDFLLRVEKVGCSSLDLSHAVSSGGERLWSARQRLVATTLATRKSCPWPDDLRAALLARLEPAAEAAP